MRLSFAFADVTHALVSLNAASEQLAGVNLWREPHAAYTLGDIDPQIAQEVPYAPSKRVGNPDSVWAKFHFDIMMRNFHRMKTVASDPELSAWTLSAPEATRFFAFSNDVTQHVGQHHDLTAGVDYLVTHLPATSEQLPALMRSIRTQDTPQAAFFHELAGYLPPNPETLFAALRAMGKGTVPALRDYGEFFKAACEVLPERAQLGPVCSSALAVAPRVAKADGSLHSGNDLTGRLLQAYYADKRDVPFTQMGLDPRAKAYFGEKGIFERTLGYFQELSNCPLRVEDNGAVKSITAADTLALYTSWYRKASIVEMVTPQFTGAAAAAANQFKDFLTAVKAKTQGRLDLVDAIEADSLPRLQQDNDLLRRIGRLAMAMDAHGNAPGARLEMDSGVLLKFAKTLWSDTRREQVWGSAERYVPDAARGLDSFRQDIATLLYATAQNVESHAALLPGQPQERTGAIATVKQLALDAKASATAAALYALITDAAHADAIARLASDALYMQAHPERFNAPQAASGIRCVRSCFGLENPLPVAVPAAEIRAAAQRATRDVGATR
jgi:hypothetical protein